MSRTNCHVVQVEAVHDVEVAVGASQAQMDFVHHRLHVGGTTGSEAPAAEFCHAGVAFRAAFHAALARQQQDVVVVEDFHEIPSSYPGRRRLGQDARADHAHRLAAAGATGQVSPGGMMAVTFTNKAAKEMLTRLSAMLP
jgi:hypothetical protein